MSSILLPPSVPKESWGETFERHTIGRVSSLFRLPLELVTLAGVITKIAIKALIVSPGDSLINLGAYLYAKATGDKTFKYMSAWGADAEGFARDGRSLKLTLSNISNNLKGVIIAPTQHQYYWHMNLIDEIKDCARRVFTNREPAYIEEMHFP